MKNVIVYIDGFNLYHAINDLKLSHLKWVNLWCLSESLLRSGERLIAVKYYSAYAKWLPGPYARHRQYVQALTRLVFSRLSEDLKASLGDAQNAVRSGRLMRRKKLTCILRARW
jgi:hypothetical protein